MKFYREFMSMEVEKLRQALAANIKKRRKILGISQEQLAEAADLSFQTINGNEGCRIWVSDKTIVKLARALRVEAYQLLIPNVEPGRDGPACLPPELLLTLQQMKTNIDLQFDEILKSGVSR
jgi:transcriptional regulator with XRE-family HTH domain